MHCYSDMFYPILAIFVSLIGVFPLGLASADECEFHKNAFYKLEKFNPETRVESTDKRTADIILPTQLTANFYKKNQVCADAKKRNPGKKIAVILSKSHLCDVTSRGYCLDAGRMLSSGLMEFAQKNFAIYHARFTRVRRDQNNALVADLYKGSQAIATEWDFDKEFPQLTFLNLKTCKTITEATAKVSSVFQVNYDYQDKKEDTFEFYKNFRNAVLASPAIQKILDRDVKESDAVMSDKTINAEWARVKKKLETKRYPTRREFQAKLTELQSRPDKDIQDSFVWLNYGKLTQDEINSITKSSYRSELDVDLPQLSLPVPAAGYKDVFTIDDYMVKR